LFWMSFPNMAGNASRRTDIGETSPYDTSMVFFRRYKRKGKKEEKDYLLNKQSKNKWKQSSKKS